MELGAWLAKTVYEMRFVRHIFVRSKHFARFYIIYTGQVQMGETEKYGIDILKRRLK